MSDLQVLGLPKKRFFWLERQADRLAAGRDRRMLNILSAAGSTSQEVIESVLKRLDEEEGVIYEFGAFVPAPMVLTEEGLDPAFDREGLRALKARHGA